MQRQSEVTFCAKPNDESLGPEMCWNIIIVLKDAQNSSLPRQQNLKVQRKPQYVMYDSTINALFIYLFVF